MATRRRLVYILLALATIATLSGGAVAVAVQQLAGPGSSSSIIETGSIDGTEIPGFADHKGDKARAKDPIVLIFMGAGLIVLAYLGKQIRQK